MSEIITHINKYEGNDIFSEYPIGSSAEYVTYINNHRGGEKTTVQEYLDSKTGAILTFKDENANLTFDGSKNVTVDLSKFATDIGVAKLNDLGKIKANAWFYTQRTDDSNTRIGNGLKRYYNTDQKGGAVLVVPKWNASNNNNSDIKDGWKCLNPTTPIIIPKGQTWLVTYNVTYMNRYRGAESKAWKGTAEEKNNHWFMDVVADANLGTARSAMFSTIAPTKKPPEYANKKQIAGINGYTGARVCPMPNGWSTVVSKTILLPKTTTSVVSSAETKWYLWTQQNSSQDLPCSYDYVAIRVG